MTRCWLAIGVTLPGLLGQANSAVAGIEQLSVEHGQVTLSAEQVTLAQLLSALGQQTGVEIDMSGGGGEEKRAWQFQQTPVEEVYKQLLHQHNVIRVYRDEPVDGKLMLQKLMVLARQSEPALKAQPETIESVAGAELTTTPPAPRFIQPVNNAIPNSEREYWIQILRYGAEVEDRVSALQGLAARDDAAALAYALGDPAVRVRDGAVQTLGRIGTEQAVLLLGQVLYSELEPSVRRSAVDALAQMPPDSVAAFFLQYALNDSDREVSARAQQVLSER